jgi:hypothetical protein
MRTVISAAAQFAAALSITGPIAALLLGVAAWTADARADEASDALARQDYAAAAAALQPDAAKGDATAQLNLGILYSNGQGVAQDYAEAKKWFAKSADQGNDQAATYLAALYIQGHGVKQDYAEARKWLSKAVAKDNLAASRMLGQLVMKGLGGKQDTAEAIRIFQSAIDKGDAESARILALFYIEGTSVTRDYAEGAKWLSKATSMGDLAAEVQLGALFHNGVGVTKSDLTAIRLWSQAADKGDVSAQYDLATLFEQGYTVRDDEPGGEEIFAKLRQQKDKLLDPDKDGKVPHVILLNSLPESLRWYQRAADGGSTLALLNLAGMYRDGRGAKQDYVRAMGLFRQAASSTDNPQPGDLTVAGGEFGMSNLYENGLGVPKDLAQATSWYCKAAAHGLPVAKQALGGMLASGANISCQIAAK